MLRICFLRNLWLKNIRCMTYDMTLIFKTNISHATCFFYTCSQCLFGKKMFTGINYYNSENKQRQKWINKKTFLWDRVLVIDIFYVNAWTNLTKHLKVYMPFWTAVLRCWKPDSDFISMTLYIINKFSENFASFV